MNIVTRMLKRRASKKIEVLKACVAKNEEKRKINHDEYESLRNQYALLLEKIKFADENDDMVRRNQFLSNARSVQEKIAFSDSKCKIYEAVYSVFDKFLALIQFLYDTDNYFMVIRSIPQHKLPRLINNTGKLKILYDLVAELYNDLKNKAMVSYENDETEKKFYIKRRYARAKNPLGSISTLKERNVDYCGYVQDIELKDENTDEAVCLFYEQQKETQFYHNNPFFDIVTVSNDEDLIIRSNMPF